MFRAKCPGWKCPGPALSDPTCSQKYLTLSAVRYAHIFSHNLYFLYAANDLLNDIAFSSRYAEDSDVGRVTTELVQCYKESSSINVTLNGASLHSRTHTRALVITQ